MTPENFQRAKKIQHELHVIGSIRERWEDPINLAQLCSMVCEVDWRTIEPLPAPVAAFKRAALDVLATKESVLKAEFEQL